MMNHVGAVKADIKALLAEEPQFGPERLPAARSEYARLSAGVRGSLEYMVSSADPLQENNRTYRASLLQMVSLECAAGARRERCRAWFRCLADLAGLPRPGSSVPVDPMETIQYSALAGDFSADYTAWPDDIDTELTSARVFYRLMTEKQLNIRPATELFDARYWLELYESIVRHDNQRARSALIGIADLWFAEYRDSDLPIHDLSAYPCFEPLPNAALALANLKENMNIRFHAQQYDAFYIAALL